MVKRRCLLPPHRRWLVPERLAGFAFEGLVRASPLRSENRRRALCFSSDASPLYSLPAQSQCVSPLSHSLLNVAWPVGEPNLPPALDRSVLHVGRSIGESVWDLLSRKRRVWFCSTSFSLGVPEPLPVASVEAVRSHPRVSVRVFLP
ncbi:unnamed protein product [Brassica napus]|uniref:(rape) hypothetical protein n=1 Tax=Brassica napus TaxID=3708 RepID=A0A816JTE7_BRANA|nr:unnamed protein product [Brassica napus]